jgi:NAD(P)-dependent dehydrogenase (short-subunit alcohol dehydrogenase family)
MHAFEGSVAVITGGASGLGFALAVEAQKRGCKLVIGDIREDALKDAARKLSSGGEVLTFKVDVSNADEVEALAAAAVDRFGKVNILFNNAGVFASGITWETSVEEYDWVIGVNQRSVIHGIRSFVPRMIAQGDPCHVVTISSGAGITVNPGFCTYSMTKHAVVALTEALYLDLTAQAIKNIGVTIAMPGMTQSGIMSPEKTTPGSLQPEVSNRKSNAVLGALETLMSAGVAAGLPAADLARMVFDAMAAGDLYVLPGFSDDSNRTFATGVGVGRASGQNPYPPVIEAFLASLKEIENVN